MKKITCFFLVLLALVFIFPVLFLVVGSLMGKNELTDLLFPVLQKIHVLLWIISCDQISLPEYFKAVQQRQNYNGKKRG